MPKSVIVIGAASAAIGWNPFHWAWCDTARMWMAENPLKATLGVMSVIAVLVIQWLRAD